MFDGRPALCRICEFPVANCGVRVAELNLEKFGRWWLQTFETDFDDDASTVDSSWLCQFCLCDAKFLTEESENLQDTKENYNWWIDHDPDKFYAKCYYQEGLIQPCKVKIVLPPAPTAPIKASPVAAQPEIEEEGAATVWRVEPIIAAGVSPGRSSSALSIKLIKVKVNADGDQRHPDTVLEQPENLEIQSTKSDGVQHKVLLEDPVEMCSVPGERDYAKCEIGIDIQNFCSPDNTNAVKSTLLTDSCANSEPQIETDYKNIQLSEPLTVQGPVESSSFESRSTRYKKHTNNCICCIEKSDSNPKAFKEIPCKQCSLIFNTIDEKKFHVRNVHPINYQCHVCDAKVTFASGLRKHVFQSHKEIIHGQKNQCCGQEFGGKEEVLRHMLLDKFKTCNVCQKVLKLLDFKCHMRKEHGSALIRCHHKHCKPHKILSNKEKPKHIKIVHGRKEILQCKYCPFKYRESFMGRHVAVMHPSKAIGCFEKNCFSYFVSEEKRDQHVLKFHTPHKEQREPQQYEQSVQDPIGANASVGPAQVQTVALRQSCPTSPILERQPPYVREKPARLIGNSAPADQVAVAENGAGRLIPSTNATVVKVMQTFQCSECDYSTTSPRLMKLHQSMTHSMGITGCDQCRARKKLPLKLNLKKTLCEHCKTFVSDFCCHQQEFSCGTCGVTMLCLTQTCFHLISCMETPNQQKSTMLMKL